MKLGTTLMSLWMNFRQVMGATGPPPSTLLNDLVSYWPLNEVSGTRYDAVGTNDLTDNNTVGAVLRGPEGTVARAVAANSESLSVTVVGPQTYTLLAWVKGNGGDNFGSVISMKNGVLGTLNAASEYSSYPGQAYVGFAMYDGIAWNQVAGWTGNYGSGNTGWHMVAATCDGTSKKIQAYLDGVAPFSEVAFAGTPGDFATTDTLIVGGTPGFNVLGETAGWQPELGPSALWNRVLTEEELTALFASGNGLRYAELSDGLKTGLVSWWELDEVSGVRYDSHGSNDLTDNNTVGSVINAGAAMDGAAASFVAANGESLTITDNASLSPAGANASFTISAWAKIPATGLVGQNIVVCKWGGAGNVYEREYFIILIANGTADYMDFFVGNGVDAAAYIQTYPAPVFTDGAWHHILAWHDGDESKLKAQVNGGTVLEAASVGTFDGNGTFAIGRTGSFGSSFSDLTIDEVAYWSRVLTADERAELYALGRGRFYDFS